MNAIIAHEVAHIKYGEASLTSKILVASLLTLVGQNLFHIQINYWSRELRADRYAVEKAGVESLERALEAFDEYNRGGQNISAVGLFDFGSRFVFQQPLVRFFDLFFGDYSIRKAHPDTQERLEQLQELSDPN